MAKKLSAETAYMLGVEVERAIAAGADLPEDPVLRATTANMAVKVVEAITPIIVSIDANAEARGRALERGEKVAP